MQRVAISSVPDTSESPRNPPCITPLMHSYKSDIAGVVRMRSINGGRSLRVRRGSSGVRVAN
jgi:hypothetical protein